MKLKKYIVTAAIFVLAACSHTEDESFDPVTSVASAETTEAMADTRPNILFIVADDLGFTDIGAFGSEIPTPNLDELALGGLRLNSLRAAASCQPTRAMIMAGVGYAQSIEERPPLPTGERNNMLSLDWAIIPELMQEAGYATYMSGKWDLGFEPGYTPDARGFDKSFAQIHASSSFFREYFFIQGELGFQENGVELGMEDLDEDFYVTEHYTSKMLEFLQEHEEGTPWFGFMPYTAPHWPLQLPDDWLDRYAGKYEMGYDQLREQRFAAAAAAGVLPANSSLEGFLPLAEPWADLSAEEQRKYSRAQEIYAGMVEYMDMSIGRVISYLEESGQLENTIIVFTSDHGASPGEQGVDTGRGPLVGGPTMPAHIDNSFENFGKMGSFIDHGRGFGEAASAPFRNTKGSLNDGGVRAAGFVYYPKQVAAGGVSQADMSMMDFLPTFLEVAGTEHPGASTFRGREIKDILGESAWPHLTGKADQVHSDSYFTGWSNGKAGALLRGGEFKIINYPDTGRGAPTEWRLYDLINDPGERTNIVAQHPEMVAEMVAEWETNWK